MPFDITSSNQCRLLEDKIKTKLYYKLFQTSRKTGWVRITGVGVALPASLISIALSIVYIFELLIKGFANLIAAPCLAKFSAKRGAEQLFKHLPKAILGLIFTIVQIPFHLLNKTVRVVIEPQEFYSKRWMVHDAGFNVLVAAAKKKNVEALLLLGRKFHETKGLPEKDTLTFECYEKAAEAEFVPAQCQLALCYDRGIGVKKDKAMAIKIMQDALNAAPQIVEALKAVKDDEYWKPVDSFIKENALKPTVVNDAV